MPLSNAQRDYLRQQGAGLSVNQHGNVYRRGASLPYTKKLEVASAYSTERDAAGKRPNISAIARQCGVTRSYVRTVEDELNEFGRVLQQEERKKHNSLSNGGLCSNSLSNEDVFVLYQLYLDEPSRTMSSYVEWLHYFTGTVVSESTISNFFNKSLYFKGGFRRPNLVPFDKFRPENYEKMLDYLDIIERIDPSRIKFGDEKHLKGQELYNRKVRRDPITGLIPPTYTNGDFRNTYAVTGFCGIDPYSTPVWYNIHEEKNGADEFALQLEMALASGFFRPGDVLVLDNASIHNGGNNDNLEEWLYETFGVLLLFLPARSPELNPIEQVWKILVNKLQRVPLSVMRSAGSHACAHAAIEILSTITHEEVEGCYRYCDYL